MCVCVYVCVCIYARWLVCMNKHTYVCMGVATGIITQAWVWLTCFQKYKKEEDLIIAVYLFI